MSLRMDQSERNAFEYEFLQLCIKHSLGRNDNEMITTAAAATDYLQEYLLGIGKEKGLKRINIEAGFFIGSVTGKRIEIETSLSVYRYKAFQEYEKEMGFGTTFKQMFDQLNEVYALLNAGNKQADAIVKLDGMRRAVALLSERQPTMFKLAALFCNYEDEDRGTITKDLIDKKIADMGGYDTRDVFTLATNSVRGFMEVYKAVIQNTMDMPIMGDQ